MPLLRRGGNCNGEARSMRAGRGRRNRVSWRLDDDGRVQGLAILLLEDLARGVEKRELVVVN
eukprot:14736844-Heterocapsa_arctica.AAC.1